MGANDMRGYNEIINLDSKNYVNDLYIPDFKDESEYKDSLLSHVYIHAGHRIDNFVKKIETKCDANETYNNLIPLLGDRGTGKTSAMESVIRLLTDVGYVDKRKDVLELKNCDTVNFISIDRISADILTDRSIFETVLIAMFNKYSEHCKKMKSSMDHSKDYMRRNLSNQFAVIYECFKNKDNNLDGISNLYDVSKCINLKAEFCELVNLYTDFMNGNSNGKSFFIIPIDDLDQNIQYGYHIMEEIHQYFMSYNIIIFLTMDLLQFSYVCEKYFSNISPQRSMIIEESKDTSKKKQYWMRYVSKITQNYVDKILPAENRVYLPGIHNENRIVKLKNFESTKDDKGNLGQQPIKWVILNKIFRRTGVICDGLGRKKHYYEPGTVRKVVRLVNNLEQMESLCKKEYLNVDDSKNILFAFDQVKPDYRDTFCEKLQSNTEIIYKDIVERMEYEKLQPDTRVDFDSIRRQHITRQGQTAMRLILQETIDESLNQNYRNVGKLSEFANKIIAHDYAEKYNYGNYIYVLQQYSYFNIRKEMVHLLLAMQTANLTNLYNNILLSSGQDREEYFIDLRQIINGSISGTWFKEMLYHAAKVQEDQIKRDMSNTKTENRITFYTDNVKMSNIIAERTITFYTNNVKMSDVIEVLCCLLSGDQGYKIEKIDNYVTIKNIDFEKIDPLGFVMWYFDSEKRKEIVESVKSRNEDYSTEIEELKKESYEKCALPIYSMDVYYNLLKRLFENKEIYISEYEKANILYADDHLKQINYKLKMAERALEESKKESKNQKELLELQITKESKEKEYNLYLQLGQAYQQLLLRMKYFLQKQDTYYNEPYDFQLLKLEDTFCECPLVKMIIDSSNESIGKETQCAIHLVIGFLLFHKIKTDENSMNLLS